MSNVDPAGRISWRTRHARQKLGQCETRDNGNQDEDELKLGHELLLLLLFMNARFGSTSGPEAAV